VSAPVTWTVDFDRETELILDVFAISFTHDSDVKERASAERRRKVAGRSGRQVPNRREYANDPGQNDDAS
jgi:hypothetical protein